MRKARGFMFGRGGVIVAMIMALTLSPVGLALGAATLTGLDIVDGSIKTVDLGKAAVTGKKLAANSVGTAKIVDGSILAADLATGVALSGPKGDKGNTGSQGIQGIQGLLGLQGIQGSVGSAGADGINGIDGTNGLSAYQVAVLFGFVGDEATWLASLVGPAGVDGSTDAQTLDGLDSLDFATATHNHDSTYYTQAQVDALVAGLQTQIDALTAENVTQQTGIDANTAAIAACNQSGTLCSHL